MLMLMCVLCRVCAPPPPPRQQPQSHPATTYTTRRRYALQIGSSLIWLMRFFTWAFYIFAKPVAMVLDCMLGQEMGTIYNKNEVRSLCPRAHALPRVHVAPGGW